MDFIKYRGKNKQHAIALNTKAHQDQLGCVGGQHANGVHRYFANENRPYIQT